MDTFVPFAVPGEGVGHRVTPDHEKDKGRAGSQQHHEPGEADPTSRLHMTDALSRHLTGGALQECAWLVRAWFLDFSTNAICVGWKYTLTARQNCTGTRPKSPHEGLIMELRHSSPDYISI